MPKLIIGRQTYTLRAEETLLEAMQRLGYEIEYQCREGYCGSCRMRVQGQFVYRHTPLAFALPGEVISCCAIPKVDIQIDAELLSLANLAHID